MPRDTTPRLDVPRIVAAARTVLTRDGIDCLTMRGLAMELDRPVMSLYRHVRDRDELLLLLLADLAEHLCEPPTDGPPIERALHLVSDLHNLLGQHPWAVSVLAGSDLVTARGLAHVEALLETLLQAGLDPEAAIDTYRGLWHLMLGDLLARHRRGTSAPSQRLRAALDADAANLPILHRHQDRYIAPPDPQHFARTARLLLTGADLTSDLNTGPLA